jgi:phosphoribosylglycinamide formyltransferase 1
MSAVVLASGRGSNLAAVAAAIARGELKLSLRRVLSDRSDAPALERARELGIESQAVPRAAYPDRERFEQALMQQIDVVAPGVIILAGYMRILSPDFVARYAGRVLNIHPSLLPEFPGLDTHARALAAGAREHGASVHFVTDQLDGGPVIARARVPVLAGDTPETLAERVLVAEHRLYPAVLNWYAIGRLLWRDGRAILDGRTLSAPVEFAAQPAGATGTGR